jgi:prepilin peptidase CpaA
MVNAEYVVVGVAAALLVVAAVFDGYSRIIPNRLNLTIAVLALPYWWCTALPLWPDVVLQIGVAAITFAVLLGVFHIGQMGGGDVKLLIALALFMPPMDFLWMTFGMAMIGGILTSGMLVYHRLLTPDERFENPYGIAIAASALLVFGGHYRLIDLEQIFAVVFDIALVSCVVTLAVLVALRRRAS